MKIIESPWNSIASDNGNYIRWQDFGCKQATGDGKIVCVCVLCVCVFLCLFCFFFFVCVICFCFFFLFFGGGRRCWVGDGQWQWQLHAMARFRVQASNRRWQDFGLEMASDVGNSIRWQDFGSVTLARFWVGDVGKILGQ